MLTTHIQNRVLKILSCLLIIIFGLVVSGCKSPQLMKYSDFSKLTEVALPKILYLESKKKSLLYVGTYHSNDKKDSLFSFIQQRLEKFQPDYVFHEGGRNWPIYDNIDSTKSISGEPGFIIQLCQSSNIKYSSIEPNENQEYEFLLSRYQLKWVVLMYLCRQVDQQKRLAVSNRTTDVDFIKNMNYFLLTMFENGMQLSKEQLKFEYWKKVYRELLQEELDWKNFNANVYYPNHFLTKLNEINRASDEFRNLHMVEVIMTQLKRNSRVLILVGGGHLIVQEKLLKHKFNKVYN